MQISQNYQIIYFFTNRMLINFAAKLFYVGFCNNCVLIIYLEHFRYWTYLPQVLTNILQT